VRAEQTDGRQPMRWSDVDWAATEAVVGRIQDRIFRAAKTKRPRLEPDDEQSSCPVLRGLGSGNGARLPDWGSSGEPSGPLIRHRQVRENYSALYMPAGAAYRGRLRDGAKSYGKG
jgi:hypothetical protein